MSQKLFRDLKSKYSTIPLYKGEYGNVLGKYYIDFESDFKKLNRLLTDFDKNGVPLIKSYIDVEDDDLHYYPISIGQYGLALFHDYLTTKDVNTKTHFIRIADWFLTDVIIDKRLGSFWLTEVPKPEYNVTEPWKSAFSQSRGLSILLRAWQITGNDKYLATATDALRVFDIDIEEGGVSVDREIQETFYEEYVAAKPTRVLDGHIFSLFGLYDYIRAVSVEQDQEGHQLAQRLFDEGITGLLHTIDKYDLGYWLLFNRCELDGYPQNDPCTIGYLKLVAAQFDILHQMTNNKSFEKYRVQFDSYINWKNIIKMYKNKFGALKKLGRL